MVLIKILTPLWTYEKIYILQWEGARYAARFFVKRPVGLRSFWDLGICVLPSVT